MFGLITQVIYLWVKLTCLVILAKIILAEDD